jgi:putative flavoprotein involved in K+ transport
MTLVGRTESYGNGVMHFASDIAVNIARGDADYLGLLEACDAYVARNGLDLSEEPEAKKIAADPECVTRPILELDLKQAGVTSIVWATGFVQDFSWIKLDAFDAQGQPVHRRGVSPVQGLYFLGLPWLSRRGSSFIWGVWHDARYIADQIGIQRSYLAYDAQARGRAKSG